MTAYSNNPLNEILQWCKTLAEYDRVPEIISLFLDMTKHHSKENYATLCHDLKWVKGVIAQDPLYIALKEGKISWWLQYEKEIVDKINDLDTHYQDWRYESLDEIIQAIKNDATLVDAYKNKKKSNVEAFKKTNFIASIITKYKLSQDSNANALYPREYHAITSDRILKTIRLWWNIDMYFILFFESDLHSLAFKPVKFDVEKHSKPAEVDLTIDAAYINYKLETM